ncbi:MAG TPA: ATP-binding protein [Verrucomicrobiae bacterium]
MRQPALTDGSPLVDSLRQCLVPALVVVNADGTAVLSPEASRMLRAAVPRAAADEGAGFPPMLLAVTDEAIRSETGTCSRTLDFPAGGEPLLSLQASAVRLAGAANAGAILILNDLTGFRKIEQLMLQADRLANIGTISAGMAHEVRNALVACRTFVELLLEKHQDSELAGVVSRELRRIDDIVSRMLRHSSTVVGKRAPLQVGGVLDNALRLLQPRIAEKHIRVERSFNAVPDRLDGDENQLQQAFLNLLLNSLEALPSEGLLRVETGFTSPRESPPAGIWVTIGDTGSGIPPEHLARIFEPFFTTKPDGTGLGLAVTQRIVKDHGGTISVESRVGEGTSFRVCLPA